MIADEEEWFAMFPKFWLAFTALMLVAVAAVLWWAIRSGQFRRQDRARYLPLDGPPPEEKDPKKDEQGKLP